MNHSWPTIWTTPLLLIGLIPLAYVAFKALFARRAEGLSLRVWSVLILWIAYHASPFLAHFFSIPWTSVFFDIAEQYIDYGLLCSDLCIFAVLWGYHLGCPQGIQRRQSLAVILGRLNVSATALILLTGACAALFVVSVGGWGQVWTSTEARGTFQWMDADFWWRVRHAAKVAGGIISPTLAALATIYALRHEHRGMRMVLAAVVIAISMCQSAHGFSRTTGLSLIIPGVLILNLRGIRAWRLSSVVIAAGLYLSMVGLTQRPNYDPGVGSYLEATMSGIELEREQQSATLDLGSIHPLAAIERFTIKAEIKEVEQPDPLVMASHFLWNLHPFPSVIVPLKDLGTEPTEYLGLTNKSGVPSPALGELVYAFGMPGCIFFAIMGCVYGRFDRLRAQQPGIVSSVCYFLCVVSIGASTHAGCRTWTRFVFYALIVYWTPHVLKALAAPRKRWPMVPSSPGRATCGPPVSVRTRVKQGSL